MSNPFKEKAEATASSKSSKIGAPKSYESQEDKADRRYPSKGK